MIYFHMTVHPLFVVLVLVVAAIWIIARQLKK